MQMDRVLEREVRYINIFLILRIPKLHNEYLLISSFLPWVLNPSVSNQSSIFLVHIYVWMASILKHEFYETTLSVVQLNIAIKSSLSFTTSCWFIFFSIPSPKFVARGILLNSRLSSEDSINLSYWKSERLFQEVGNLGKRQVEMGAGYLCPFR